jgi:ABC-2 family transporter
VSALAAPAPGRQGSPRDPVPWRKLAWVTWRQHRFSLGGLAALFGGVSLWMLVNGLLVRHAMASLGLGSCHRLLSGGCAAGVREFATQGYADTANTFTGVMQAVPVLAGVFTGGPLLARELETGTARFAWTQGCGRLRWVVAKLVPLAVLVTAGAAVVTLVTNWYMQPFFAMRMTGHFRPTLFDLTGTSFAAWTLAAFAIAALTGLVIKRTVPTIAVAAGAWSLLLVVTTLYLRKRYQPPLTGTFPATRRGIPWVLANWMTGPGGHRVTDPGSVVSRALSAVARHGPLPRGAAFGPSPAVLGWLARHGYHHLVSYQPASRFWHFQLTESGWLLGLALLAGAATVWLTRRRSA